MHFAYFCIIINYISIRVIGSNTKFKKTNNDYFEGIWIVHLYMILHSLLFLLNSNFEKIIDPITLMNLSNM